MKTAELFSPYVLKDKVSLVTGSGRGLGKAMALALAQCGSSIVVTARTQAEIDCTAQEISEMGAKALAIRADVTRSDDIARMVEQATAEFGKIDVLINNAGQNAGYVHHKCEDIPEQEWVSMMQTNVNGVFLVSKIVGSTMLARGSGKIINIASSFGVVAVPERLCYSVTKAAVIHLTKVLAVEWAPRGITVTCIAPGSFDLFAGSTDEARLKLNEERIKRVPLGRLGRPEELGLLVVYLASDASDYMTGETIFMTGGWL